MENKGKREMSICKKYFRVFRIKQTDCDDGFQTLKVEAVERRKDPHGRILSWEEVWRYEGELHNILDLLREEQGDHGRAIRDDRIYYKYIPQLAKRVSSTFFEKMVDMFGDKYLWANMIDDQLQKPANTDEPIIYV